MGDRHAVGLQMNDHILWFYSHYGFSGGFAKVVAQAIKDAEPRWDDSNYGNRIVISRLLENMYDGSGAGYEYGSGLSFDTHPGVEHSRFVIDFESNMVSLIDSHRPDVKYTMSFERFVEKYS